MANSESAAIPLPRISRPANDALAQAGITSLNQLSAFTEREIKELHGMGPKGMRILAEAMAAHGVEYASAGRP